MIAKGPTTGPRAIETLLPSTCGNDRREEIIGQAARSEAIDQHLDAQAALRRRDTEDFKRRGWLDEKSGEVRIKQTDLEKVLALTAQPTTRSGGR